MCKKERAWRAGSGRGMLAGAGLAWGLQQKSPNLGYPLPCILEGDGHQACSPKSSGQGSASPRVTAGHPVHTPGPYLPSCLLPLPETLSPSPGPCPQGLAMRQRGAHTPSPNPSLYVLETSPPLPATLMHVMMIATDAFLAFHMDSLPRLFIGRPGPRPAALRMEGTRRPGAAHPRTTALCRCRPASRPMEVAGTGLVSLRPRLFLYLCLRPSTLLPGSAWATVHPSKLPVPHRENGARRPSRRAAVRVPPGRGRQAAEGWSDPEEWVGVGPF